MKTRYSVFFLILGICLLCGCDDFLDVKPKGKDIPEKIAHYDGLFNNTILTNLIFSKVNENGSITAQQSEIYFLYMTDELITDEASFANMGRSAQAAYTYDPEIFLEEDYSAEWSAAYQQIYLYNVIANGVMDADDGTMQKKKELLAEARVGRAFMHFYLAQFFCKPYHAATAATDPGVPVVTKANSVETSFSRGSVKDVYDFVIKELEEACPELPKRTQHRQRVYQAAGYFMLGKVYMAMGEYDKALNALNMSFEAIQNSSIVLELFDYNQEIYNWGYLGESNVWGMTCTYPINLSEENNELLYNKQVSVLPITLFLYPSQVYVKPEYMALYSVNDHRAKFFSDKDYTGVTQWPYFKRVCRYMFTVCGDLPDLYLMLAECKARTGDETGARADLLTLRKNRMPEVEAVIPTSVDSKEKLIRFVLEERTREFMMSGMRWFDIRRLWNDPLFQDDKKNYTHKVGEQTYTLTEERLTYRIPPKVLTFNREWVDNN